MSHSLVAPRQFGFFYHCKANWDNVWVRQIAPKKWNGMERKDGFRVVGEGDIYKFIFDEKEVLPVLTQLEPTHIYCQEELSSLCANQCAGWAETFGAKLVYFVWENLRSERQTWTRDRADLVIAGNSEAKELQEGHMVMPQVGVDPQTFFLRDGPRPFDTFFASSKHTHEKGWDLYAKLPFKKLNSDGKIEYESMGALYGKSKVVVTPSRDAPRWKEQFSPFANVEALMSGCNVVASDTAAMVEWLRDAPDGTVEFFEQGYYDGLERTVKHSLDNWTLDTRGRNWAIEKFGHEAVAEQLLEALSKA